MTHSPPPPKLSLLPETAPFTPEQRAWLDGFFAAALGLGGVTALSPQDGAALIAGSAAAAADADDRAPWHDQTLPLVERLKLADGRPLRRRMMAAMGQQDCGQCGYNCQDYADAIFFKQESRLNLCVPGGKETLRALKSLHGEMDAPALPTLEPATPEPATPGTKLSAAGGSRENPTEAIFLSRTLLNKPGSAKTTWHIEFDLSSAGLDYVVGDCFGILPTNDPDLVEAVIKALGVSAEFAIDDRPLRQVLANTVALGLAPDSLFQLYSYITGGERRQKAKALASGEDPDGDAAMLDVLAAMEKFHGVRPDPEAFVEALEPLQPRLYSISSSPKSNPGRVSLTVDAVRYRIGKRLRLGVASTFLGERVAPHDKVRVYVQRAQHFALPADPAASIIMIGPGTGVAPFRAFLHERMATKAPGRNWLLFGHQHRDYDFFYEDEFAGMRAAQVLTRLSLAWSRDGEAKFYVQDRMREVGRDLWAWLADGAHVYVCGDAKHMAKDVERALVDIVAQFGARSTDEAIAFVAELKKRGRYQQDVY
ncbi:MAG TPA: sulfite reductase subunit alpha [Xanthobacteraceae bacterium]|jgi:sulfite reductase (NADPH) flavoprotein alpha-component